MTFLERPSHESERRGMPEISPMRVLGGIGLSLICVVTTLACGRIPLDDPAETAPAGSAGNGGSAGSAGSAGTGSGGGGVAGAAGAAGRVPAAHRPTASSCPAMMLPFNSPTMCPFAKAPGLEVPAGWCNSVSDCTAGQDPRCVGSLPFGNCSCTYDACFSDGDCPAGEICACSGVYSGNACVGGTCEIDADCGAGGYCSPVVDGCSSQVLGYACHTAQDTCSDNTDCPFGASCAPDPSTKAWRCGPANGCPL
jgi:hypothetical protein